MAGCASANVKESASARPSPFGEIAVREARNADRVRLTSTLTRPVAVRPFVPAAHTTSV